MRRQAEIGETALGRRGWCHFAQDRGLADWAGHALLAARDAVADPIHAHWLRCAGTWFAGVDVLPNDVDGRVGGSAPLDGAAMRAAWAQTGGRAMAWHRGQVSVVYPGYPRPRDGESAAAFRYRRDRDAAHLDGLLPVGQERRRMIREPHAFILGVPLTDANPGASPFVVWEGSQEVMRAHLGAALAAIDPADWAKTDITAAYHAARRVAFETCKRVAVHTAPGEAFLVHRLCLHGVAPWEPGAAAAPEGRMIAYFRPEIPTGSIRDWLDWP